MACYNVFFITDRQQRCRILYLAVTADVYSHLLSSTLWNVTLLLPLQDLASPLGQATAECTMGSRSTHSSYMYTFSLKAASRLLFCERDNVINCETATHADKGHVRTAAGDCRDLVLVDSRRLICGLVTDLLLGFLLYKQSAI